ncbi:MAG: hypothetical protein GX275_00685 [Clostridiales bacterium]|nr:hypothetical protein [Clostridiales bacterium]
MKKKNIVSFIISFILMISIILTSFVVFFRVTLTNENYYNDILNKNKTVDKIYQNINDGMNYALISNFYPGLIENEIVSKEEINNHLQRSILNLRDYFIGEKKEIPAIDISEYKIKIKTEINKYIEENKVMLNAEDTSKFQNIEDTCSELINTELEVVDYNELSKSDMGMKIQNVGSFMNSNKLLMTLFSINIILIGILFFLWKERIHRACSWTGYSFMSSGILYVLTFLSGYISKFYEHPAVYSDHLKDNIISIIDGYFKNLTITGIILIIVGILLMIVYWYHLYTVNQKIKNRY